MRFKKGMKGMPKMDDDDNNDNDDDDTWSSISNGRILNKVSGVAQVHRDPSAGCIVRSCFFWRQIDCFFQVVGW